MSRRGRWLIYSMVGLIALEVFLIAAPRARKGTTPPPSLPNQVIVQFQTKGKRALMKNLSGILARKEKVAPSLADKKGKVDEYFAKLQVTSADAMFTTNANQTPQEALLALQAQVTDFKKRRPERQSRSSMSPSGIDLTNYYVLHYKLGATPADACKLLKKEKHIRVCHPNYVPEFYALPNDTYGDPNGTNVWSKGAWGQSYANLWGLDKTRIDLVHDFFRGRGKIVAVVDSGVDINHPDLKENIWVNPCEDVNADGVINALDQDGKDNGRCDRDDFYNLILDGSGKPTPANCNPSPACNVVANGKIDDFYGWSFPRNSNNLSDWKGHGTHVAGIIGAVRNNNLGIVGVAPEAKIMPVQMASEYGGSVQNAADAIIYAADNGADVINCSWGFTGLSKTQADILTAAIAHAFEVGAIVVFAAGNSNVDVRTVFPQNMTDPKPIVVAATTPSDSKYLISSTVGSNWGWADKVVNGQPVHEGIDIAAPGAGNADPAVAFQPQFNVLSLRSSGITLDSPFLDSRLSVGADQKYLRLGGTSLSAAFVSGYLALALDDDPMQTPEELRDMITESMDGITDVALAPGRLNIARALNRGALISGDLYYPRRAQVIQNFHDGLPVMLIGAARGSEFTSYVLDYAPASSNPNWTILGTYSAPKLFDILGSWNINSLPAGDYYVRVTANALGTLPAATSQILVTIQEAATSAPSYRFLGSALSATNLRFRGGSVNLVAGTNNRGGSLISGTVLELPIYQGGQEVARVKGTFDCGQGSGVFPMGTCLLKSTLTLNQSDVNWPVVTPGDAFARAELRTAASPDGTVLSVSQDIPVRLVLPDAPRLTFFNFGMMARPFNSELLRVRVRPSRGSTIPIGNVTWKAESLCTDPPTPISFSGGGEPNAIELVHPTTLGAYFTGDPAPGCPIRVSVRAVSNLYGVETNDLLIDPNGMIHRR